MPRSGSSWIGRTLGQAGGVAYVHEPDNEKRDPFAAKAKAALGRFPVLAPEDDAPDYELLWRGAFSGGAVSDDERHRAALEGLSKLTKEELEAAVSGRSDTVRAAAATALPRAAAPGRPIVKSVHAALALPWIRASFEVDVIVVRRHPLNVLASMFDLDMPDRDRGLDRLPRVVRDYTARWGVDPPGPNATPLERAAWQVGLLQSALVEARSVTTTVVHEDVCLDPAEAFRALFETLGLRWTDAIREHVRASDRPGAGYKTARVAAEQPGRWRRRFDDDDVTVVRGVLARFPLAGWPHDGSLP